MLVSLNVHKAFKSSQKKLVCVLNFMQLTLNILIKIFKL